MHLCMRSEGGFYLEVCLYKSLIKICNFPTTVPNLLVLVFKLMQSQRRMRPPIRPQVERCSQCRKFKDCRWRVRLDLVEEGNERRRKKRSTLLNAMIKCHDLEDIIVWALDFPPNFFGRRYRCLFAGGIPKLALQFHHIVTCKGFRRFWSHFCNRVICRILVACKSSSNKLPNDGVRNVDYDVDIDEFPHDSVRNVDDDVDVDEFPHDSVRNVDHDVDVDEFPHDSSRNVDNGVDIDEFLHQVENLWIPSNEPNRNVNPKFEFSELPDELQGQILANLPYEQIFQLKANFSSVKYVAESGELPSKKKTSLTACYFFIKNGDWNWAGYDAGVKKWRLLPPLTFLPATCSPDPELFKEYLICAMEGLVCMNFSKSAHQERLIVFNPLSRAWKELPPLKYRRNPVFMHMLVDTTTGAYQVIVAGASNSLQERYSRITEVYDSCTGTWTQTGDIPGPLFAINEYQSGIYQDGKIFCIGFVEENDFVEKGVLAYDVREGKWSSKWTHRLQFSMSSNILQLTECNGEVFLFSERESGGCILHCIERLEWTLGDEYGSKNACQLVKVVQKKKTGGRGLEIYPEYVCVPYGDGQLCILNTVEHSGVVYDVCNQGQYGKASNGCTTDAMSVQQFPLQELPEKGFKGESFFSLNPMSFTIEPRFSSKVGIA